MQRVKTRIFSGAVCEQLVFNVSDRARDIRAAEPKPRFRNEEERARHREGMARREHVRKFNENFGPSSQYSTLTFDNEYEVHTFEEAKQVRKKYARRLMYHFPDAKLMIYIGRGKATNRIHFHMVSEGIPEEMIKKLWGMGDVVRIENLREHNFYNGKDHGQDYTGLANYLFDHWTPEQGGRHYKQAGKMKKPEREPSAPVKRNYTEDKPPRPPKGYILVESKATQYGYLYFKYVRKPEPVRRKKTGGKRPL